MDSRQIGGTIPGLWLPQQCYRKKTDLNVDKYLQTYYGRFKFHIMLLFPQICAQDYRNVGNAMATLRWGLWGVLRTLLQLFGLFWLSEAPDGWFFYIYKFVRDRKRFDAVATGRDSKWRIDKSLSEQRVSCFLYTVPQHLFNYFLLYFFLYNITLLIWYTLINIDNFMRF